MGGGGGGGGGGVGGEAAGAAAGAAAWEAVGAVEAAWEAVGEAVGAVGGGKERTGQDPAVNRWQPLQTMKTTFTKADFARWGSQGGQKAKHSLSPEKARAMVKAREDRKEGVQGQPGGKEGGGMSMTDKLADDLGRIILRLETNFGTYQRRTDARNRYAVEDRNQCEMALLADIEGLKGIKERILKAGD